MQTLLLGALATLISSASVDGATDEAANTTLETAHEPNVFIYSGLGPGAGETAIGVGGRLLVVVPMLDLHVVHGFTDRLDLEARLSTIGILNVADLGLRYRLFGDEELSLAVRANAHGVGVFAFVAGGASVGAAGGFTLAFGDEDWQLSITEDIPVHFFQAVDAGEVEETGNFKAVVSRTTLAFETLVARRTSLYVTAQLYVPIVYGQAGVLPFLAIGASF